MFIKPFDIDFNHDDIFLDIFCEDLKALLLLCLLEFKENSLVCLYKVITNDPVDGPKTIPKNILSRNLLRLSNWGQLLHNLLNLDRLIDEILLLCFILVNLFFYFILNIFNLLYLITNLSLFILLSFLNIISDFPILRVDPLKLLEFCLGFEDLIIEFL